MNGGAFYKLKKMFGTGKEVYMYFDIATGLMAMEEEFGEDGRKANLYFYHREVDGVVLSHLRVRIARILTAPHVAILSYELNLPLEDSMFELLSE